MKKLPLALRDLIMSLGVAQILGALLAAFQPQPYMRSYLPTMVLLWLGGFILLRSWRANGSGKALAILIILTFSLRVITALLLHGLLPEHGYDSDIQNAGYVYADAYWRNTEAYALASSEQPLGSAFSGDFKSDQYGGLLFISSLIYRTLSPDAMRPLLVTLLGAAAMSIGLAFLFSAVRERFGSTTALVAGLLYALYPESILLGSSQLREPFLIASFAVGMWAILKGVRRDKRDWILLTAAILLAIFISYPFGLLLVALVAGQLVFQSLLNVADYRKRISGMVILSLVALAAGFAGWTWLKPVIAYDAYLTQSASGWISLLMNRYGSQWNQPFVTIYGLTQPLLPAAIIDRSLPIWVTIAILRALGWTLVIPFLLYAPGGAMRSSKNHEKWLIVLVAAIMMAWTVVTSLRAGGDQWDNPRYRAILLPWLCVAFAWSWQRVRQGKAAWFYRILACVLVFNFIMLAWYIERYYIGAIKISVEWYFLTILGICAAILLQGILAEWLRWRRGRRAALPVE